MKKIIALFMLVMMVGALVAGCGGNDVKKEDASKKKIVVGL